MAAQLSTDFVEITHIFFDSVGVSITCIIATFIDIPLFNIMHKFHMPASYCMFFCVCTGDNPLAKARVLSSRTDAQTIQLLTLIMQLMLP